jgi:DNA-binding transcriptional LysR family regulator
MSDTLALISTFLRVVEVGSFSAVAEERDTSQPTISRQIAALESHLGCLLFQRTTRSLSLTDDGRVFYEHALRTAETLKEAETSVGRQRGKPSGNLRIGSAVVFGRLHLVPRLPRFMQRYPEINIDLSMNDGFTDLIEENLDLAIRVGVVTDQNLVAKPIGITHRVLVATPEYLKKWGVPKTPEDLAKHLCIVYSRLAAGSKWTFESEGGTIDVPVAGRFRVNNTEGVRAAVLQSLGIGFVPVWHFVENEIAKKRLVVLLKDYQPTPQPINAVYPSRRFLSPKVRVMIDYLAQEFALDPQLSDHPSA